MLPATVSAESPEITPMVVRFLIMFRQLGDAEQDAMLRAMRRTMDGMDQAEAERLMYAELERPMPTSLLGDPS